MDGLPKAHPEDSVSLAVRKRIIRTIVTRSDKAEILLMQAEMFRYPKERLKLSSLLPNGYSLASQV